ncbi:hypothetical protein TNCV_383981 [Trichonephila clavipes]|nr:hypothetical protein TNCV_383981 [Trichonephila clavipes]
MCHLNYCLNPLTMRNTRHQIGPCSECEKTGSKSNYSSRYSFGNYQIIPKLPTGGEASHLHRWLTLLTLPKVPHWCF